MIKIEFENNLTFSKLIKGKYIIKINIDHCDWYSIYINNKLDEINTLDQYSDIFIGFESKYVRIETSKAVVINGKTNTMFELLFPEKDLEICCEEDTIVMLSRVISGKVREEYKFAFVE